MLNLLATGTGTKYIVSEGVVVVMVLVYIMLAVIALMTAIVSLVANWKLFEKMGYKG